MEMKEYDVKELPYDNTLFTVVSNLARNFPRAGGAKSLIWRIFPPRSTDFFHLNI
jgi:hypothetical protein